MSGFTYTVVADPEGGEDQVVAAFNDAGTVVGAYDNTTDVVTGFIGADGSYTVVSDPSATAGAYEGTDVEAINTTGTIAGYYTMADEDEQGFVYADGTFTDIADPAAGTGPFAGTEVYGINSVGDLWGLYTAADGSAAAFVDIGGSYTTIDIAAADGEILVAGVSDDGTVAGSYQTAEGVEQSFIWDDGSYTTVADPAAGTGPGAGTFVTSINATGTVAGYYVTSDGNAVGFIYDDGTFTNVADPSAGSGDGAGTFITSINSSGELAGYYASAADAAEGVAEAFIDIGGVFTDIDDPSYGKILTGGTTPDISLNDAGDVLEVYSDASGDSVMAEAEPACYLPGTMIRTPGGEVPIEALAIGDGVVTTQGCVLPVVRVTWRRTDCRDHPVPGHVLPVRVQAGAFAHRQPARDLFLSPNHAIFAEGVLIPVKHLINGTSICQIEVAEVTYVHVALTEHAVILAENLPAESHFDAEDRPAAVPFALDVLGCAPLRVTGPEVERVRALLAARAAVLAQSAA